MNVPIVLMPVHGRGFEPAAAGDGFGDFDTDFAKATW